MNYDRWPDRWIRTSGSDYPHYVNIEVQDDETAAGKKSLVIDLDGAAASITSFAGFPGLNKRIEELNGPV